MTQLKTALAAAGHRSTAALRRLRDAAVYRALVAQTVADRDAARAQVAQLSARLRR